MTTITEQEPTVDLDASVEAVAEEIIRSQLVLRRMVEGWPNEMILALAERLEANENNYGFRVVANDVAAETLRDEVVCRRAFVDARTKDVEGSWYCVTCRGRCKGEEEHERLCPPLPPWEMRIREMHRDNLIKLLCGIVALLPLSKGDEP